MCGVVEAGAQSEVDDAVLLLFYFYVLFWRKRSVIFFLLSECVCEIVCATPIKIYKGYPIEHTKVSQKGAYTHSHAPVLFYSDSLDSSKLAFHPTAGRE